MITFNSFKTAWGRVRTGTRQDPVRDWIALLTLTILIFISLVIWNVWAFDTVAEGGTIGSEPQSAVHAFDRSSLDAIHAVFEARASEKAKYATGVYRYTDPSQ